MRKSRGEPPPGDRMSFPVTGRPAYRRSWQDLIPALSVAGIPLLTLSVLGALATTFPDDARFEDLLDALASYSPGGGPYLYDEQAILGKCRSAAMEVESVRRGRAR